MYFSCSSILVFVTLCSSIDHKKLIGPSGCRLCRLTMGPNPAAWVLALCTFPQIFLTSQNYNSLLGQSCQFFLGSSQLYLPEPVQKFFSVLILRVLHRLNVLRILPEAEFLEDIQTLVLRFFFLAIYSPLMYSFALRFLQTHATSYSFYSSVTVNYKGERRKIW